MTKGQEGKGRGQDFLTLTKTPTLVKGKSRVVITWGPLDLNAELGVWGGVFDSLIFFTKGG